MIISIVQLGFHMGIQLSPEGDMMTLPEIMRECNSGILKRHQGEATLVPRLYAAVLYLQAVLTMSPLGPGTGAYDVNILIGGCEEMLVIAKTSARIE
jgi:hypothetical protein